MEERKQKEIEYYDKKAGEFSGSGDFDGFDPRSLSSYKFLYSFLKDKCMDKKILDFGCGNGLHTVFLAENGGEVTAIDLSENQLKIAKKRAEEAVLQRKINFIKMDCENLEFPNQSFNVIFNSGTFSSIDLNKALPKLAKVLRRDGFLIGAETFGHNPFANLKRRLNKVAGRRTEWAAGHILKMKDFKSAGDFFNKIEVHYFHLVSWLAFPFLRFSGGKLLLKLFELIDRILLKAPFLRRYAFKVVFIFSEPKNEF